MSSDKDQQAANNAANFKLIDAITKQDVNAVKESIEDGADVNNNIGWYGSKKHYVLRSIFDLGESVTVLGVAAALNDFEIVRCLIEAGANPISPCCYIDKTPRKLTKKDDIYCYLNTQCKSSKYLDEPNSETNGLTPLGYCVKSRDERGAKDLLALGADICKLDKHKKSPLMYAVENNWSDMVDFLLKSGASVTSYSALSSALEKDYCRMDIVIALIKASPSLLKCVLPDGYTPLTKALKHRSVQIAKFLIENGADPNEIDKNNLLPLDQALEMNSFELVRSLLKKGASVNCFFSDGCTPLTKALKLWNGKIVKHLLEKGADANQKDENNVIPINQALEMASSHLVKYLLAKGASIPKELKSEDLHKIVDKNELQFFNLLLQNGWNIDQISKDGKTLLAHFASVENMRLATFFIDKGADVNKAKEELRLFRKENVDFNFYMEQFGEEQESGLCSDGAQE